MKKTLLSIITLTMLNFGTTAQNVNIPDANFKAYLVGNTAINTNMDSEIQVSEASVFTGIMDCTSQGISDMTGIQFFTALTWLICVNNPSLTTLDVSNNTALTTLFCEQNALTVLNLPNSSTLTNITCYDNALTTLDVSTCTALQYLKCYSNPITTLDLSNNANLTLLSCGNSSLTALDVSNNIALVNLYCSTNAITVLDVSPNIALIDFECHTNSLTTLNVANGNNANFSAFAAYSNPNLTCITVDDVAAATAAWTNIDPASSFSTGCSVLGINEQNLAHNLSIYPNPVKSQLTIDSKENIKTVVIMDIMGKKVQSIFTQNNIIDVSHLTKGVYFLQIQTNKGLINKKIIKE